MHKSQVFSKTYGQYERNKIRIFFLFQNYEFLTAIILLSNFLGNSVDILNLFGRLNFRQHFGIFSLYFCNAFIHIRFNKKTFLFIKAFYIFLNSFVSVIKVKLLRNEFIEENNKVVRFSSDTTSKTCVLQCFTFVTF